MTDLMFETEDDLALFYFTFHVHVQRRAIEIPVAMAERCRHCEGMPTQRANRHGDLVRWCAACRKPWDQVKRMTPTYSGSGKADAYARAGRVEDVLLAQLEPFVAVRRVVEPRPRAETLAAWRFALEAWRIALCTRSRRTSNVCEIGARLARGERSARDWTPRKVEAAIAQAREIVYERASRHPHWLLPKRNRHRGASAA